MVDFGWSVTQHALHDRLRQAGAELSDPSASEPGLTDPLGRPAWQRLARHGVMALPVPEDYGGLGHDPLTCCFGLEGLGYGAGTMGFLFSAGAHIWAVELPIMKFGTPQQRDRYLPGLAGGQLIGAHAITEQSAGSDALAVEATASRKGGTYVLTGRKRYVTNAPVADLFLVYATINPRLGFTGVSAFLVDRDQPGLHICEEDDKIGLRQSPWGQVVLDGCVVDKAQRLGAEKQGSRIFATVMAWERALVLAPLLGAMARSIEQCVSHAQSRKQFGRSIGSFQATANRIVDMRIRLETARLAGYRAAWDLGAGIESASPEIAKLLISEAAVAVFTDAMTVFGGQGYTEAAGLDVNLRDALGVRVSSGTSDIQKLVIAAKLGLR